jgi:hypothetical protein
MEWSIPANYPSLGQILAAGEEDAAPLTAEEKLQRLKLRRLDLARRIKKSPPTAAAKSGVLSPSALAIQALEDSSFSAPQSPGGPQHHIRENYHFHADETLWHCLQVIPRITIENQVYTHMIFHLT